MCRTENFKPILLIFYLYECIHSNITNIIRSFVRFFLFFFLHYIYLLYVLYRKVLLMWCFLFNIFSKRFFICFILQFLRIFMEHARASNGFLKILQLFRFICVCFVVVISIAFSKFSHLFRMFFINWQMSWKIMMFSSENDRWSEKIIKQKRNIQTHIYTMWNGFIVSNILVTDRQIYWLALFSLYKKVIILCLSLYYTTIFDIFFLFYFISF